HSLGCLCSFKDRPVILGEWCAGIRVVTEQNKWRVGHILRTIGLVDIDSVILPAGNVEAAAIRSPRETAVCARDIDLLQLSNGAISVDTKNKNPLRLCCSTNRCAGIWIEGGICNRGTVCKVVVAIPSARENEQRMPIRTQCRVDRFCGVGIAIGPE